MDHAASRRVRVRLLRKLACRLWLAGVPLYGIGCATSPVAAPLDEPPTVINAAQLLEKARGETQLVSHTVAHPAGEVHAHQVPITLDTVLRLAEEHNPRIGLAREKLHESVLVQEQSCRSWMPQVYAGVGYYRHEGGIQNEDGTLTHSSTQALYPGINLCSELDLREATYRRLNSERQTWQQKAELSQVNNEVLLDAATTYIDLLVARRGEAIANELERYERSVVERAEKLEKEANAPRGLVESAKAAVANHTRLTTRLRQQGNAASAKLVYLLGLPPETCLVPMDLMPTPIELVDVTPPVQDLVMQAMTNGPGVRELEGVLNVIQRGIDQSYGIGALLPSFQATVVEGAFGAGPGSQMSFDNRLDIGLQMRWNLTQLAQAGCMRRQAQSKQQQALLNYEEVRNKLAAGVQESREAVLAGRAEIGLATGEIKDASVGYEQSNKRLQENQPGGSVTETLTAIRQLEQAHFNYLGSISNHNKAQVRLLLLLGAGPAKDGPACHP